MSNERKHSDFDVAATYFDFLLGQMKERGNPYAIGPNEIHKRYDSYTQIAVEARDGLRVYSPEALDFLNKQGLAPHANSRVISGDAYEGITALRIKYLAYIDQLNVARENARKAHEGPEWEFDFIAAVDEETLEHPKIITQEADDAYHVLKTWRDILPFKREIPRLRKLLTFMAMEDKFM